MMNAINNLTEVSILQKSCSLSGIGVVDLHRLAAERVLIAVGSLGFLKYSNTNITTVNKKHE